MLIAAVLVTVMGACGAVAEPRRSAWPEQFQVEWTLDLPYVKEIQSVGLTYTYRAWQDTKNFRQKIVRDELETTITLVDSNEMYEVFPAKDHLVCWKDEVHGGSGPVTAPLDGAGSSPATAAIAASRRLRAQPAELEPDQGVKEGQSGLFQVQAHPEKYLSFVLPDLREKRWRYRGHDQAYLGSAVAPLKYEWDLSEGDSRAPMTMAYTFWVDARSGAPLELRMLGANLIGGSHKDEYVVRYTNYTVGPIPDSEFSAPDLHCLAAAAVVAPPGSEPELRLSASFRSHAPPVHFGDSAFDAFAHRHGRRHATPHHYEARRQVFHASAAFVDGWNAARDEELAAGQAGNGGAPARHRLELNRFADWTREEYVSLLTRRPGGAGGLPPSSSVHVPAQPPHMLPDSIIWKGTPVDSPVKDQASCGSCWAFSVVGALEAAHYRATGKQLLLSEQHILDCDWGGKSGGTACGGGDQIRGFDWVLGRGGVAPNEAYPYKGVNDFCRDTQELKFKGKAVVVEGGEEALMDALVTKGTMAVSVDASSDYFRFYASGVFYDPDCATGADDLDHAVLVSGYGTSEDGVPYWLVKNTWSSWWGEDGYIRIARPSWRRNDCGISTQPIYVDLTLKE